MFRCALVVVCSVMALATADAAAPPGKTRELTKEEEKAVVALAARGSRHAALGELEQVAKVAQQIADYRRERQGGRHWQAIDARFDAEDWLRFAAVPTTDRPEVMRAMNLNDQGAALLNRGRAKEAEKLLREALSIRRKVLGEENQFTASSYNNVAACLKEMGRASEALPLAKKALTIHTRVQGENHPSTARSYNNTAACLDALGKPAEVLPLLQKALGICLKALGEEHPATANSYNSLASSLQSMGKPSEALPLYRKALGINQKVLGENHDDTANSYNNLAQCLQALGKSSEALPLYQKGLGIRLAVLGEDHPDTAISYNSVASCLNSLGKSSEAMPAYQKALGIRLKVLGENHPRTAASYNGVAFCFQAQGKISAALPQHQKALIIRLKVLGEDHPDTAVSFNNVGVCLMELGRSAEALPLHRKALAIRRKVLGERHPLTAFSYNNVAGSLNELGKPAEAIPFHREALTIRLKALGEDHPDTAQSSNNVAQCLGAQGKSSEALPFYQQALAIRRKVQGENHPETAGSYNNVASCLRDLGRSSEALPLYQKALGILQKVLGENHPTTAKICNYTAVCLVATGQVPQAARLLQQSLVGQEAARFHLTSESGFDRAVAQSNRFSGRVALAVLLRTMKQPRNAFAQAEASLARGLLDDLDSRDKPDVARLHHLQVRLARLDSSLLPFFSISAPTTEERTRQAVLVHEQRSAASELAQLVAEDSARRVLPLERIQRSIPDDSALLLWIEFGLRLGCIVRRTGAPVWVELSGSGKKGDITKEDETLPTRLHQAFTDPATTEADRRKLSDAFVAQLLDPLRPSLKGVKRLFVVPSGPLARVPLDALVSDFAIHYVPSGSVLALSMEKHRALEGTSILAVGDPIFDKAPPAEPPASGVLVLSVLPGTFADKAGLQSGDVLLSVGKTALDSIDDLSGALSSLPANADIWRDGKPFTVRLQGSPLGAVFDKRSARAAVRAWRRERESVAQRSTGHKRLPGTRLEVEAISSMVEGSTLLLGSDASEQKLDDLIDSGKLKSYRLIHIATHGQPDEQRPGRSSLILAQDKLPDPLAQVKAEKHPYDGQLTVSRIRERWTLDADLVVLSACETGLGKEAGGEGLLGFAQAFLSKGARSVLLSMWKVDDTATSLLMIRLYENLLGKRKGVKAMGRAASLDEAKKWLRTLPRKEAERLATLHTGGVLRGSEGTEKTPDKVKKIEYKGDTPFAHPYYWAAFTLIGDPD